MKMIIFYSWSKFDGFNASKETNSIIPPNDLWWMRHQKVLQHCSHLIFGTWSLNLWTDSYICTYYSQSTKDKLGIFTYYTCIHFEVGGDWGNIISFFFELTLYIYIYWFQQRRFINLDSGCNGVAVVQMRKIDGDPSPKDIVQHMMTSVASTRKPISRFMHYSPLYFRISWTCT